MKFWFVSVIFFLLWSCSGDSGKTEDPPLPYDSLKATSVDADEYGMRRYIMAFLYRGDRSGITPDSLQKLQQGHLQNIIRLETMGKLVLAGPFLDEGELRGIFLFAVDSVADAEELTKTDPAIQAGILRFEFKPWYGSAALMEIPDRHAIFQKKSILASE